MTDWCSSFVELRWLELSYGVILGIRDHKVEFLIQTVLSWFTVIWLLVTNFDKGMEIWGWHK
jgi:hypothetical protein